MIIPNLYGQIKHVPNHQPVIIMISQSLQGFFSDTGIWEWDPGHCPALPMVKILPLLEVTNLFGAYQGTKCHRIIKHHQTSSNHITPYRTRPPGPESRPLKRFSHWVWRDESRPRHTVLAHRTTRFLTRMSLLEHSWLKMLRTQNGCFDMRSQPCPVWTLHIIFESPIRSSNQWSG